MSPEPESKSTVKGWVSGRVQGVGFRYFVSQEARRQGVTGYARNLPDGRVEFLLQGEQGSVDAMLAHIKTGPVYSRVISMTTETLETTDQIVDFRTG